MTGKGFALAARQEVRAFGGADPERSFSGPVVAADPLSPSEPGLKVGPRYQPRPDPSSGRRGQPEHPRNSWRSRLEDIRRGLFQMSRPPIARRSRPALVEKGSRHELGSAIAPAHRTRFIFLDPDVPFLRRECGKCRHQVSLRTQ